jgi:hypothetical protein
MTEEEMKAMVEQFIIRWLGRKSDPGTSKTDHP